MSAPITFRPIPALIARRAFNAYASYSVRGRSKAPGLYITIPLAVLEQIGVDVGRRKVGRFAVDIGDLPDGRHVIRIRRPSNEIANTFEPWRTKGRSMVFGLGPLDFLGPDQLPPAPCTATCFADEITVTLPWKRTS